MRADVLQCPDRSAGAKSRPREIRFIEGFVVRAVEGSGFSDTGLRLGLISRLQTTRSNLDSKGRASGLWRLWTGIVPNDGVSNWRAFVFGESRAGPCPNRTPNWRRGQRFRNPIEANSWANSQQSIEIQRSRLPQFQALASCAFLWNTGNSVSSPVAPATLRCFAASGGMPLSGGRRKVPRKPFVRRANLGLHPRCTRGRHGYSTPAK